MIVNIRIYMSMMCDNHHNRLFKGTGSAAVRRNRVFIVYNSG